MDIRFKKYRIIQLGLAFLIGIFAQYKFEIFENIYASINYKLVNKIVNVKSNWNKNLKIVEIESSVDYRVEKAYFYATKSKNPQPLIVSLHTWDGDYKEYDYISKLAVKNDLNYIHPNFRGPNKTVESCCSDIVIADIDTSIDYALKNAKVNASKIYIIGASGGGYASLAMLMKSRHKIAKFSVWVPITDLDSFFHESVIRNNGFAKDILDCTNSKNEILNSKNAKKRSPLFWVTPIEKIRNTKVSIFAGAYDGIQGSVPITHSINFYNKLIKDMGNTDKNNQVLIEESYRIIETRKALGNYGKISNREIFLKKTFGNIELIIFKGNHEILSDFAFNDLISH